MGSMNAVIGIVGAGSVASYWLEHYAPSLCPKTEACVTAIFRSSRVLEAMQGIDLANWRQELTKHGQEGTALAVEAWITAARTRKQHPIVIDLTAAEEVTDYYPAWVAAGAHLISANKDAGSRDLPWYQELRQRLRHFQRHWFYTTTVGAGLPILTSIAERRDNGDALLSVEGNLSGSLSWIFRNFRSGDKLSQWLKAARRKGLTESDPRRDLSGIDVARKLIILAREANWPLQLDDIETHNLVPSALAQCSTKEFLARTDELDRHFEQWRRAHHPSASQFAYLGYLTKDAQRGYIGGTLLVPISADTVYAKIPVGDTNVILRTEQHDIRPLRVQGPGAGPKVTATGIHHDLRQLLAQLAKPC